MNWWRAHHGLPFDSKLAVVAKRCGVPRCQALAVWVACLDFASQHEDRGAVEGIDPEEVAISLDLDTKTVELIIEGFRERDMISVTPCHASVTPCPERITAWERRQVQRERDDDSTDRQRRYRQKKKTKDLDVETPVSRHVTPSDAPEQNRTEQIRAEQTQSVSVRAINPRWKRDVEFAAFASQYGTMGAALIDEDFSEAYEICWKTLDFEQKAKRIVALAEHASEYADNPRFTPKPLKFLQSEWARPRRPPIRDSPSSRRGGVDWSTI